MSAGIWKSAFLLLPVSLSHNELVSAGSEILHFHFVPLNRRKEIHLMATRTYYRAINRSLALKDCCDISDVGFDLSVAFSCPRSYHFIRTGWEQTPVS